eukprot:GEMP01067224.1.p1 GENE.GEMP01067224.1~~GEMP01067224.1.p1  ORF type:complete len:159 (+),score=11.82 GEMP01067224.1:31-477(+)
MFLGSTCACFTCARTYRTSPRDRLALLKFVKDLSRIDWQVCRALRTFEHDCSVAFRCSCVGGLSYTCGCASAHGFYADFEGLLSYAEWITTAHLIIGMTDVECRSKYEELCIVDKKIYLRLLTFYNTSPSMMTYCRDVHEALADAHIV